MSHEAILSMKLVLLLRFELDVKSSFQMLSKVKIGLNAVTVTL